MREMAEAEGRDWTDMSDRIDQKPFQNFVEQWQAAGGPQWNPAPESPTGLTFLTGLSAPHLKVSQSPGLRLWLPGYHTPSLNRTAGKHWAKVRRLRLETAEALYEALRGQQFQVPSSRFQVEAAKRVLSKILLKVPLETRRGKRPDKPTVPAWLRIERVACVLLDEENFKGGTKGLTDLLRYAFPTVLLDDGPGYVVMEHVQTRCAKRCEEGTWVELRLACGENDETRMTNCADEC